MSAQESGNSSGKGRGRPSKYGRIDLDLVRRLAETGLTDKQIAHVLEIHVDTLNEYKKSPQFSESLKRGKAVADEKVERALFERATGYSHPEDKVFCDKGMVTTVATVKHYPPDVTACIFWLKNRKPGQWRSSPVNDSTNEELNEILDRLSREREAKDCYVS